MLMNHKLKNDPFKCQKDAPQLKGSKNKKDECKIGSRKNLF